jgi:hypothetical protein
MNRDVGSDAGIARAARALAGVSRTLTMQPRFSMSIRSILSVFKVYANALDIDSRTYKY